MLGYGAEYEVDGGGCEEDEAQAGMGSADRPASAGECSVYAD